MSGKAMTCGVVVVELRGFEPLTPCMPSRDPHHDDHHKPLRSVAGHCTGAGGPTRGGSRGFVEQSCCAPAAPRGLRGASPMCVGLVPASPPGWSQVGTVALDPWWSTRLGAACNGPPSHRALLRSRDHVAPPSVSGIAMPHVSCPVTTA